MIYLYPSKNTFSVFTDKTALPEEYHDQLIEVETLPEGSGVLRQSEDGLFYYDELDDDLPVSVPEFSNSGERPSLEEMQMQTLLNTEYLVVISELSNL